MLGQSHLRSKPCFYVLRKPAFGAIQPTTLGMGAAEMQEIAAIIASVLRATAPTKTASRTGRLARQAIARELHAGGGHAGAGRGGGRATCWAASRCTQRSGCSGLTPGTRMALNCAAAGKASL